MTRPRLTLLLDSVSTMTRQSLSKAQPGPLKRVARGVLACIGISLLFMPEAGGDKPKEYVDYKTYALYLLEFNYQEHQCLVKLYTKESNWRPEARNGSHYGIPQGRSEYLARVDGYKQIQWGLLYINHRYSTPCNALNHWKDKGWH